MSEEQLLILKMVEEGRITAEEGVELLEALADKNEPHEQAQEVDGWRRLEKHGEEFADKVEGAVEKFSKSLESKLEGKLGDTLQGLPKLITKIPFMAAFSEENHTFEDQYFGTFKSDLELIPVEMHNVNGPITIEGWDQERFKLVVTQKIRGKEREIALQKVIDLEIPESAEQVEQLNLTAPSKWGVMIAFHLYLPRKHRYILDLGSNNGRCTVADLNPKQIQIRTINGSIVAKQLKVESFEALTTNGSCELDRIAAQVIYQQTTNGAIRFKGTGEKINCESTNGSIRVTLLNSDFNSVALGLQTTNGSIACRVPQKRDLSLKVDAHSALGKVNVSYKGFVSTVQERFAGSYRLQGEVEGIENPKQVINISTQVKSGSISVLGEEDDNANG